MNIDDTRRLIALIIVATTCYLVLPTALLWVVGMLAFPIGVAIWAYKGE